MIAVPGLLARPAEEAGIKLPPDLRNFSHDDYPHWAVYCNMQLGRPMPVPTAHWDNAKVVASIPDTLIMEVTNQDVINMGFQ